MPEIFQLYNYARQPISETMVRGGTQPPNTYRTIVQVCLFNSHNELLIQQRQHDKESFPNCWDLTAGGSAIQSETSQQAAMRELHEELGLQYDLTHIAPNHTTTFPGGFNDVYFIHDDINLERITLQLSEVQSVKWATYSEIMALIKSKQFIPYHPAYIELLFHRHNHPDNYAV
ncbi:NUDIX domain-containing protein [Aerococcaceae bacterium NML191292]|nr:NUDIX domain-containing protein [Aerococcaceae bacterium NML191292]